MENKEMILLDTDIIIEWFKGNTKVEKRIVSIDVQNICISKVSVLEMYVGALNKRELNKINKFLDKITQLSINDEITDTAVELIYKYYLSHTLYINDALIAATAIENKIELYTLNQKDFKFIEGLKLLKL